MRSQLRKVDGINYLVQCKIDSVNLIMCGNNSCINCVLETVTPDSSAVFVSVSSINDNCTFASTESNKNKCQSGGKFSFVNDPKI